MEITTESRVHNRCVAGVYKYNDGVNHRHLIPLTKVAQYLVDYKSGTFKNFCSFQLVICSVAMDLTQLDNPAKLLKLMQQFGDDADNPDKEIDAVISICLESGLESTILDDFKLLIQIGIRDETSDRPFFRQGLDHFLLYVPMSISCFCRCLNLLFNVNILNLLFSLMFILFTVFFRF